MKTPKRKPNNAPRRLTDAQRKGRRVRWPDDFAGWSIEELQQELEDVEDYIRRGDQAEARTGRKPEWYSGWSRFEIPTCRELIAKRKGHTE